ncbi:glycoside hydrolase family 3 C-terminal domain-containing protein [Micromonospora sp. KC213]|uniref:glycoside hydrolase family 3 C-terminal domain-containing protein n=1 Tax=Micromonospora sp. KC213 TaxID=2530378 RepID=UPI0010442408|nr:glycoside hydrolase family 3 C-terminal domain-containing protein [Micromonospora sp. KC213]TDC44250.1 hypothetical protein E1166_00150 [Micromonospora sp. KC213]
MSAEAEFTNPALPVAERVRSLLNQLTLDEKLAMMHQYSPGIPRLGIPPLVWGIAVRRGADPVPGATVFPQAVGLGATWNPNLITRIGAAIAAEIRAYHHQRPEVGLAIWGPVTNLLRDPRWGRNEEGYSECPVLTSALATAMCRGLSGHADSSGGQHRATTPVLQHFLAYNHENGRGSRSAYLRPRVLHEYDLRAFRTPIVDGVADGVMLAYSRVNGVPNHLSPHIRGQIRAWNPDSVVMSDAWAPSFLAMDESPSYQSRLQAYAAAVRAGLDLFVDQGDRSDIITDNLRQALADGLISEGMLDAAVGRLLRMRMRWGQFDARENDDADCESQVVDAQAHRQLAARAAAEAIVLLTNRDDLLPLDPAAVRRVVVVGQLAAMVCRDWYSPQFDGARTPVAAVTSLLGQDRVSLVEGVDVIALRCQDRYIAAPATPKGGELTWQSATAVEAPHAFAVFDWGSDVLCLRAESNGRFLRSRSNRTVVNDRLAPEGWQVRERFRLEPHGTGSVLLDVSTGHYVAPPAADGVLRVAAATADTAAVLHVELITDGATAVGEAAADADAVVAFVGNHPLINGREAEDRTEIGLAPAQERVVHAAAAANPATVVALVSSYPLAVEDIAAAAPAMLWSSHAGPELGTSLTDAIFGVRAPAGRLPQTWPRRVTDLGDMYEYDIIKGRKTYLYSDTEPLFSFGHGLTYTRFWYDMSLLRPILCVENPIEVSVEVGNPGPVDSNEVLQLYARARQSRHPRALRQLLAFRRVHVPAGTALSAQFTIPLQELAMWDVERHEFVVEPGDYDIMLGRSSTDIVATRLLTVRADPVGPRRLDLEPVRLSDFDDYHAFWPEDDAETGLTTMICADAGAWLVFRDVVVRGQRLRMRAVRPTTGWAAVEIRMNGPEGDLLAVVAVVADADDDVIDVPLAANVERGDIFIVSTGAVRLTTVQIR